MLYKLASSFIYKKSLNKFNRFLHINNSITSNRVNYLNVILNHRQTLLLDHNLKYACKSFYSSTPSNGNSSSSSSRNNDERTRIYTIPNVLTVTRIALTPIISYLMLHDSHLIATTLFLFNGFTDFLDGYIARNYKNQKSYLGSILDPLADKLFIGCMTITLGLCQLMPFYLMVLILARDLLLILSSVYVHLILVKQKNKKLTLNSIFNFSDSMKRVRVEASALSKLNTFLQILLIGLTIPSQLFDYNQSIYLIILQYLTAFTTVSSGILYLISKGSYKIIK